MDQLQKITKLLRYHILTSTTKAGSGHVTSSLSAVELMATLFFKYFRFDLDKPGFINNDRLIFSKGHASPLFYSLYAAAGKVSDEEMLTLRQFDSVLEGHPTKRFKYTEVPTGSLGQGLSAGVGMALSGKIDNLNFLTYVLLGDGEIAEGQIWEAINIASYYKLNNLIGIIDVNRLGQTGPTITGSDLKKIEDRVKSFGWKTYLINDGHDLEEIDKALNFVLTDIQKNDSPYMVIARTVKGNGVSFLEDKEGWHGKALSEEECENALKELGGVDKKITMPVKKPDTLIITKRNESEIKNLKNIKSDYKIGEEAASREGYGKALVDLGNIYGNIIVMDGDLGNSTYADLFKKAHPERFYEMYIAEQNMVSVGVGLSERGKVPFISSYGGFFTRALDQIRMANLSETHLVLCGSHAGVATGQDGPSQMGLEDLSFMRSLPNTEVFYPSDAVSAYELTKLAYGLNGLVYIKTTRPKTKVIYQENERFELRGSKILKKSDNDTVTVIAAGITVHEALKAYEKLKEEGVMIRVIDAYSIKPIDEKTIQAALKETKAIITVEDHYVTGGLGDAVLEVVAKEKSVSVYKLGVTKIPRSGKPEELLEYEEIDSKAIINQVKKLLR